MKTVAAIGEVSTAIGRDRRGPDAGPRQVPALTIVSHPMARRVGERLLLEPLLAGRELPLSRSAPDFVRPGATLGAPLLDPFVSRKPLVFGPGKDGAVRLTVPDDGTRVVAGEPIRGHREFRAEELASGMALELAERVVVLLHRTLVGVAAGSTGPVQMVGESAAIQDVRRHIERVADLNVPVLIRGETGTGKELIAQALHQRSARTGRFVSVNLGAIPKELAAAELFGAVKGAFTGARDRDGLFVAAEDGTLFLDEVGEAPPEVQVMLLRVLETGELYPVGASAPITSNARIVAATDAALEGQILGGTFKAPLLHRLAGYEIRVPPLRERREDIGLLFQHFAREELQSLGEGHRLAAEDPYAEPWLPAPLAASLVRHDWPGNIRQLRNVTRQLVIGSRGQPSLRLDATLARQLEHPDSGSASGAPAPSAERPTHARRKPSDVDEAELLAALRASAWDLKAAADRLGVPRSSMYDLIDRSSNLRTAGDLSAEEIARCFSECDGDLDAMVQRLEVSGRALSRRLKELGLEPLRR